jgi:predicted signal transduction protein with EAL and GGDEF domain
VTNRFLTMSYRHLQLPICRFQPRTALKRADFAQYAAKQNGKNQTFVYTANANGSQRG